jgi:replicative DNA helicase
VPYVVAGRPGHGKTALGWQIAEGIARGGDMVAFLSQEMPRAQLVQRAIAQAAAVEPDQIRSGKLSPEEWGTVAGAVEFVSRLPIAIDDRGGHTGHSARSAVRRCAQKLRAKGHAGKLGLIVLDYVQIMADARRGDDSRSTAVGENMRALTRIAKEFRCPVLVLSQLNREIDKRPEKRPKLSDLGESGAIEQDAYGVIFVYRADCYRDEKAHDGLAEIIIAKHRNGRTGTVTLRYLASTLFAAPADALDDLSSDFEDPRGGN